ncbi:MAG: M55 family metallopeptidase [Armatimonadota bacterium]|nr:M55 family metallopeptidase [Armatimonadota bacterium]
MKIYIMTDLEGVGGVVNKSQVFAGSVAYEKACERLTLEVNAAVEGALAAGADEIVVVDGHGANSAVNLIYDKLHPGAVYIQGVPWTTYPQDLDETYDAVFQIGAHAMAGTPGAVLEHTMSSEHWVEMRINGKPMGEIGLIAACAGVYDVPFVMVSGCDKACAEARALVPEVECAVVKYGITRHCARVLPHAVVLDLIRQKAGEAVKKARSVAPFKVEGPVAVEIDYLRNDMADMVKERLGVEKIGPRTVRFTGRDIIEAYARVRGA